MQCNSLDNSPTEVLIVAVALCLQIYVQQQIFISPSENIKIWENRWGLPLCRSSELYIVSYCIMYYPVAGYRIVLRCIDETLVVTASSASVVSPVQRAQLARPPCHQFLCRAILHPGLRLSQQLRGTDTLTAEWCLELSTNLRKDSQWVFGGLDP